MTDLPPKPRRVAPTRRTELRSEAERVLEREARGETLFGLPIERTGEPLSPSQLLYSARLFAKRQAQADKKPPHRPKQRCI